MLRYSNFTRFISPNGIINIALIICLAVIIFLFGPLVISNLAKSTKGTSIGSKLNLQVDDWAKQPKTLVLVLQTTCRYCNESIPFYKSLEQIAAKNNTRLIAVFPQNTEISVNHLKNSGINTVEVKQSDLDKLNVATTPTLILTDKTGQVQEQWVGKLSSIEELEVIESLKNN